MIDIISHPDDSRIPIDYETIVDAAKRKSYTARDK